MATFAEMFRDLQEEEDTRNRRPWFGILRIDVPTELPKWIKVSKRAAYDPRARTVWMRRDLWWRVDIWLHELGHWLIQLLGGQVKQQRKWDRQIMVRPDRWQTLQCLPNRVRSRRAHPGRDGR